MYKAKTKAMTKAKAKASGLRGEGHHQGQWP